jgi:arsenate reductase
VGTKNSAKTPQAFKSLRRFSFVAIILLPEETAMPDKIFNVLFLCTANSARSIMAEATLNWLGRGKFRAFSAGSDPAGTVHPLALAHLKSTGIPADGMRSKSWDEFSTDDAPLMDFIITVCDNAAGEVCPVWPGHPTSAHWGFPDPAAAGGTDEQIHHAFATVCRELKTRLEIFCNLPLEKLDRMALHHEMTRLSEDSR